MAGSIRDRGAYEDRESLIAQIGALKDELDTAPGPGHFPSP